MSKNKTPKLVVGIVASFMGLAGVIIFLLATKIVSVQTGILMLVMSGNASRIRNSDSCLSLDW
jgi:hypothetical protein